MPIITKLKTKTNAKSYQMRLTITPKIHDEIVKARKKYKYLDDVEIVKIFIGHGVDFAFLKDDDEIDFTKMSQSAFVKELEDGGIPEDYSRLYSKTTGKKLKWF
jgi:hypothetical protein